ncbi:MAG TPA: ParB/RepB/Spo0J family partition protein [Solirubrobacteraceae bacterium]|nr:ParB/RepB/Spo0J family partition protein [Solirubrobacteraceae bacterium]
MSAQKRGIGRGLEAILSASPVTAKAGEEELRELPLELISPNPRQPRGRFDEETLAALAGSLGERGVLQPVLVRPKPGGTYELVAGERRWRAAELAGLSTIPALVRPRADAEALELALIENMAREDLNPIDEARACAALVEELGLTREEVGRRVGRGRVAVTNLIRLLDLPDEVIELVEEAALSEGHGRALLLAEDHRARRSLAREAATDGWSVRVTEANARLSNAGDGTAQGTVTRGRRAPATLHPDAEQAAQEIAEALTDALGTEVNVKPRRDGGYRVELSFSTPDEAIELARSLRARSPT